ncbi:hypothetical protein [Flavobacterium sp.]|uniref:hypothetical protein n=1 Tax=Flavobacterium sp. TaxID=239 RepID=UPI0037991F01
MKKILKFSLVLVVALTAISAHAADVDFLLKVKKEQGKRITFAFNEVNKVALTIYDTNDKLINSEELNSKGIINRTYDLNALPEGTYFLEAESEFKVARYEISVDGTIASLADSPVSVVYKPVFVNKNGLISLSILNLDKSPVEIKIYDADNTEVYKSAVLTDQNVSKFFNINETELKNYTFVMSYDDKVFTESFK